MIPQLPLVPKVTLFCSSIELQFFAINSFQYNVFNKECFVVLKL